MRRLASSAPRSVTKQGVSICARSIARATSAPSAAPALTLALLDVPREAAHADVLEERIRIELLHVEHARAAPLAGHHHHRAGHRRHARGVRDGLRADLLVHLNI